MLGFSLKKIGFLFAVLSMAGCTTAQQSVFRQFDLDSGRSLTTDASQRIVINTKTHPSSRPGRVNPERIVCAEPSPDVAAIVANTFGFGLNVLGKGNAAISAGQSTALAQLAERTVTVQLLRDQMYRACEAYANGAISGTDYSLIMSRNNDAMVTLMLGESASRIVGRQLASLTAEGASNATASMPDILEAVEAAAEAQEDAAEAGEALAEAENTEAAADAAVQNLDEGASEEAKDNAEENAEEAAENVKEKEEEAEEANEEAAEKAEKAVKVVTSNTVDANATSGGFKNGAPQLTEHAVGVAKQLAAMQEQYLDQGAEEHFISACIVELGRTSKQYADYNSYNVDVFGFEPQKEIVFTRKEYNAAQYELIDAVSERYNIHGKLIGKYAAKHRDLSILEKHALDYAYLNSNDPAFSTDISRLPSQKQLPNTTSFDRSDDDAIQRITAVYSRKIATSYDLIEALDDHQTDEAIAAELQRAFRAENDWWSRLTTNDKKRTDRLMRATFAVEDRERASFLTKMCMDRMKKVLKTEHEAHKLNDILDYLENVEEHRASVAIAQAKKGGEANKGKGDDKNKNKPDPKAGAKKKTPTSADIVAKYIKCDLKKTEAEKKVCRIEAMAGLIKASAPTAPSKPATPTKAPKAPAPPMTSASSSIKSAQDAYFAYRDSVKKFDAAVAALPDLCKGAALTDAAKKNRCDQIAALQASKTPLETVRDQHTAKFNNEFSASVLAAAKKNEDDYKAAYQKWVKAKKKDKPALKKKLDELTAKIVPLATKFKAIEKAFKKTAGDMDAFVAGAKGVKAAP